MERLRGIIKSNKQRLQPAYSRLGYTKQIVINLFSAFSGAPELYHRRSKRSSIYAYTTYVYTIYKSSLIS